MCLKNIKKHKESFHFCFIPVPKGSEKRNDDSEVLFRGFRGEKMDSFITILLFLLVFVLTACGNMNRKSTTNKEVQPRQTKVVIEIILEDGEFKDSLIEHVKDVRMECFTWKNHVVLFGNRNDTLGISALVSKSGIELEVKRYNTPMYIFDKARHCENSATKKKWRNYLLTANLVEDSLLRQEYMDYHHKQFEEWPEVAQGFCNADFQQLLMYRNGRQLLLVISIPYDKTLDELNPKTIENNPRMDEWNGIMGEYQEGIEGTKPDEIWVFLEKVE